MKHYEGFIPAAYTPCHRDGELNLSPIVALAGLYTGQGAPGVFICGSTGESHSFTTDERKQVAWAWQQAAPPGLDVIVHVGHNTQRDAIALAAHAREIGAAAVAAMAPCYFLPETVEDLISFLQPIAAAAGSLPFYFYDIPSMTGVSFPADRIIRLAASAIPNFAGLKFTSSDLMRLQACLAFEGGKYDILYGTDEVLLATAALGVKGAVGSTYNYAAPVYRRMMDAFCRSDMEAARLEQLASVQLVQALVQHGVLRAGKAIMSLLGIDCGPVRPPLRPVSPEETQEIYNKVQLLDVFPRPLRLTGAVTMSRAP
jgi:N-acetylneuraminate lyase